MQPMSSRPTPSPRLLQPYSPRRPSPLGFPPLAPHMAWTNSSYPLTPERPIQPKGPSEARVHFPPEARRPLAGTTQRRRSQPPAPLTLNTEHHPPTQLQVPQHKSATQPGATQNMSTRPSSPPSPTPSDTSSLSLYSAESVSKNFPIDVQNPKQKEEEERSSNPFCTCLNFRALFGLQSNQNKILAPPQPAPAPSPQIVQVQPRRRPSPLNI